MKKKIIKLTLFSTLFIGLSCELPLQARHRKNNRHHRRKHRVSRGGKIGIGALFGFGGGAAVGGVAGGGKWAAGGGVIGLGIGAAIAALATRRQKYERRRAMAKNQEAPHTARQINDNGENDEYDN